MWMQSELWNWQPKVCEIYWEKTNTVSAKCLGATFSPKSQKKGSEKKEFQGVLKSSFYRYYCLLSKRTKWKYGSEDSVSNFDLSLTAKQPINVWLCDTFLLLICLDNITGNQEILGCSEIIINFHFKHVEHVRIIWSGTLPGAEKFK